MIEAILSSGIGGFLSALVTPIVQGWQNRKNAKLEMEQEDKRNLHELEILKIQQQTQASKVEEVVMTSETNKYIAEISQNVEAYKQMQGDNKFSSFVASTVRPVITYAFTAVFLYILIIYIRVSLHEFGTNVDTIQKILDNGFVQGMHYLFANIVTFWFGNRMLDKSNGKGLR
jgi:Fe2+ transport system protein B